MRTVSTPIDLRAAIYLPDATGGYKPEGVFVVLRKGVNADGLLSVLAGAKVLSEGGRICEGQPHVTHLDVDSDVIKALLKHSAPRVAPATNPPLAVEPVDDSEGKDIF
jgi:hypothetical protein